MCHWDHHSSSTVYHSTVYVLSSTMYYLVLSSTVIRRVKEKATAGLTAEDLRKRPSCILKTGTHKGWLYEQGNGIQEHGGHCIWFSKTWLDFLALTYWLVCSLIYSFFFFCWLTTKVNKKFLLRCWDLLKAWVNGRLSLFRRLNIVKMVCSPSCCTDSKQSLSESQLSSLTRKF